MESRNTRRSSILKPPKPRNPLMELEQPNDNTTTRLTRRVSFASSNFIKEFATDPERNTIWNVTYEEIVNISDSTCSFKNAQDTFANHLSQQFVKTTQGSYNVEDGRGHVEVKNLSSTTSETFKPIENKGNTSQPNLLENKFTKSNWQNKSQNFPEYPRNLMTSQNFTGFNNNVSLSLLFDESVAGDPSEEVLHRQPLLLKVNNVSSPKMVYKSVEIPQEVSLVNEIFLQELNRDVNQTRVFDDSAKVPLEVNDNSRALYNQPSLLKVEDVSISKLNETSLQNSSEIAPSQFDQQSLTSQENIDAISFEEPFWVAKKYESALLLEDFTLQLHSSLDLIDCSTLHYKNPIISLPKHTTFCRTKLNEFKTYLEERFVEIENINKSIKEINEALLREMTLPLYESNYEKIDFDALQNYSFEDDMDLTSNDSSAEGSLLNENDEKFSTIREKIYMKHFRCKEYCSIMNVENSKCTLDTLFGSIRLEVHFNDETGKVNKIEICDRLSDKSESCALLAHKVFRDTLSLRNIGTAVGEHYDILSFMDYIYVNMQKVVDFLSDLDTFEGRFGLKMDSNFREFAADPEQNTIWNVTYEEIVNKSDSTHSSENAQSTHSSQQPQQLVQTTKASICLNNIKIKSKQVESHDLVPNQSQQSTTNETSKPIIENISQTFLTEDQVAIKTNFQNKTVMECEMDLTQIAPNDLSAFNKTFANNSTMEFTDFNFIPALNSTTIQQDQNVKLPDEVAVLKNLEIKDVNLTETSMDITDIPLNGNRIIETKIVIPLINTRNLTEIQDMQDKKKCLGKKDNSNLTTVFHESMDVTQSMANNLENNLEIGQNIQRERSVGNIFNKTVILDESMEFTQKVPTLPCCVVDQGMEFRKDVKIKLFNESTEFTEPISLKQHNFENPGNGQNQQSDGAENVALLQNELEIAPSQLNNKTVVNQTNLFNESMEFTHQVPPNFGKLMEIPDEVPVNPESFRKTLKQDADKIVNVTVNSNKSMEFTQKVALEFDSKIMENQKQTINENPSALFESIEVPSESVLLQYEQKGAIQQNPNCTNIWSESIQPVQEMSVNREVFKSNSIPNLQVSPIQDQNVSRPKVSKFTLEDSSLELKNKEFLGRRENVSIPKICHANLAYNLESSLKVDENEKAKMKFTENQYQIREDLKKTLHHQSGGTQNEAILKKNLELAPSRFVQKEYYVKAKLFNDSAEFAEGTPSNISNFDESKNMGNVQNQQIDKAQNAAKIQTKLEIAPSQFIQKKSLKFTQQVPPNDGKLMEIPDEVPLNSDSIQKALKQDASKTVNVTMNYNKSMEFTQNVALEFDSKIMENQKQAISENPSALFESIEVPLNSEGVLVQYEKKGAIQQNPNCTKTWSESTQLVQEMSVNREVFTSNSIPNLQISPIQDENVSRPKVSKFTFEDSFLELKNSRRENVNIPKIRHENLAYNLESSLKVDENEKAKMKFTENQYQIREDLKKTLHHQSGGTQNEAIVQKKLEIAPSRFVQKEYYVKTKLFNDSAEFGEETRSSKYNFDESKNLGNVQNQQIDGARNAAKIQSKLEIAPSQFIQKKSLKLIQQLPPNDGKLMEIPGEVPLNPEISQKTLEQNAGFTVNATRNSNKSKEFTQKVTQLESSKIMEHQSVLQEQTINENRSKLFESIDIPDEVPLNLESLAVKYQQKGTIQQNPNCTRTLSESTQLFKEKSLNVETFNSLQLLQISQMKDLNVSCPKMLDCSMGVAQDASLCSGKLNQKQEEYLENIDKSKKNENTYLVENEEKSLKRKSLENIDSIQTKKPFKGDSYSAISLPEKHHNLGLSLNPPNNLPCVKSEDIFTKKSPIENQKRSLKRKSEDNFDVSPQNKPFRSDSYDAKIKYESEKLLDDTTIQLWSGLESLDSSDCSDLPIKNPIISFSKPEIPFRPKLIEFEAYLEKTSVEMEKNNEAIKELNDELLREMTLPSHSINFDIQTIDFDALQNCSFESDLSSDESSTDSSLFRLNSNSNEYDENLLTILEKIHRKHSRCKEYCSIVSAENSKCVLDTLLGSIRLEVHFNDETGEVNKIEIRDRLSDESESCALLAHKAFRDTLSLKNIRAAVGEHYDILTLMDYIYMNMQKVVDFLSDLDTFERRFALKMDSNFSVKFKIVSLPLRILWWITVDISDMENISENSVTALAEVGSLEENKIKMLGNNCPRGIAFLSVFINNILSYIELLKTQRRKN